MRESMILYGHALLDYFNGSKSEELYMCRDDGFKYKLPVAAFFRDSIDFEIDNIALDLCSGVILDIGAGTGLHSLYLQEQGKEVYALDVSPEVCKIMKTKGIKNILCKDMLDPLNRKFDTILILGRGIGAVGLLDKLPLYLRHFRGMLNKKGQIILNSCNLKNSIIKEEIEYVNRNITLGRYFGEITYHFEYKGEISGKFQWLQVDPKTLITVANQVGLNSQLLFEQSDGNYLIRLY